MSGPLGSSTDPIFVDSQSSGSKDGSGSGGGGSAGGSQTAHGKEKAAAKKHGGSGGKFLGSIWCVSLLYQEKWVCHVFKLRA